MIFINNYWVPVIYFTNDLIGENIYKDLIGWNWLKDVGLLFSKNRLLG